jgi:hypothetical protein
VVIQVIIIILGTFDISKAGTPQIDPMFGTQFWCHKLDTTYMNQLIQAVDPNVPLTIDMLHLPPQNPYIPQKFEIKPLPLDDCDHPLLNAAIKLCIVVGKTKQWFPATIVQYNQKTNRVLCSYEDEDEKWHVLDHAVSEFDQELLCRYDSFEGTMDTKAIKFRIVAIPLHPGMKGAGIRKYGDATDYDVDDGIQFPPIPSPSKHVPIEISNSNVLKMWWLQDRKFKRPTTEVESLARSGVVARALVMARFVAVEDARIGFFFRSFLPFVAGIERLEHNITPPPRRYRCSNKNKNRI